MPPVLHIDVPWLLQRHEEVLPEQPTINDFSALVAAVARHRVDPPRLGVDSDPAWRAAALLHTLALLTPLPSANVIRRQQTAVSRLWIDRFNAECADFVGYWRDHRGLATAA